MFVGVGVGDEVAVGVEECGVAVEVVASGGTSPTPETFDGVEKLLHPASRPIQMKNRIPWNFLIRDQLYSMDLSV